jgi:sigma-B regulation protein RsbU (phosphoserine phosphatase)
MLERLVTYALFKGFSPEQVQQVVAVSELKEVQPGEVLITPGQPNDTFYLLVQGELRIVLEEDGATLSISIQPGECLGEMSIVMGLPTSALAIGHQPSQVLCIAGDTLWKHILTIPAGVSNLMGMMASRLKKTNETLIQQVREQLQYEHLKKELEIAGKIQASIVPDGSRLVPKFPEVEAFAILDQARGVGGDFFDLFGMDQDHVYFVIGDVSGKGMPASLFMTRAFTSLRMLVSNDPDFDQVIPSLNEILVRNNDDSMFVSLFAGALNVRTGLLRYVNGGHNPPFISLGGKGFQLMDLEKNPVVGILREAPYPFVSLQLTPGDALVLYTDGIPEATNDQQQMFGIDRTEETLNQEPSATMPNLVQRLRTTLESFVGTAPQHDDFTVLGIRYLG